MEKVLVETKELQEKIKMEKKIEKWKSEVKEMKEKQKEINRKYNEKIEEIEKKIQNAEQQILLQNNEMIARVVRETYGEVNFDTLEAFRKKMKQLKQEEKQEDTLQSEKYRLE